MKHHSPGNDPCESFNESQEFKSNILSAIEQRELLELARKTIESFLQTGAAPIVDPDSLYPGLLLQAGAFVTVHVNGKLRGCIGTFEDYAPLYQIIQEMAISAATRDSRFKKIKRSEIKDLQIQISVLTPKKKITSIEEFLPGRDGIYIQKGKAGGTLLPQVAGETGWDRNELLGHCSRDKAGIGWFGWKEADLFTYEAIVFAEKVQV
jgi:AmmeMemoRadiSam system protein A